MLEHAKKAHPHIAQELKLMRCTGQPIGSHEGPRAIALAVDTHPYTSSLVPGPMDAPPVDGITYSKGASILQMLYATMEEAKPGSFQVGLSAILSHKAQLAVERERVYTSFPAALG